MPQNAFFHELAIFLSAKKRSKDTFFPTLHPLSPVIFATATVVAFKLLRSSSKVIMVLNVHRNHKAYYGWGAGREGGTEVEEGDYIPIAIGRFGEAGLLE